MSSMLVRHPTEPKPPAPWGPAVSVHRVSFDPLGREPSGLFAEKENEGSIEAGRQVGVVVSVR